MEKFSTQQQESYKKAVIELETILLRIKDEDVNAVTVVQNALDNLLNGSWTSQRALKTAREVEENLLATLFE